MGKYQVHGPDGKLLPTITLDKIAIMAAAGLVSGETVLFDVDAQRMVRADEVPGLKDKLAPGQQVSRAALVQEYSNRKRPPFAGIVFAVVAIVAILNFAGVPILSRLRGTAGMVTNEGIPAVLANGALARSAEDLKLYERVSPPASRRFLVLPPVTRVRVLQQEGAVSHVRVTDSGANFNLAGYVPTAKLRTDDGKKPYDPYFAPKASGK